MADLAVKIIQVNENKLVIAAAIVPFSIVGTLIRIGLNRLQDYSGAPVFSLVYAQWMGCFIMGIAIKNKNFLLQWYQPSHAAITSGLCGSITTFSSWQLGIFQAFSNYHAYPHTRGKNVLAGLSVFLVTLAMAINGLIFGQHVGEFVSSRYHTTAVEPVPRGFSFAYLKKRDYLTLLFGILCWVGVILAAIFTQHQKEVALACVFAPLGALTRWYLSFYNNKLPHFPLGTWVANVFGTMILAALSLVQSGPSMSMISCSVVGALSDGYCGCLTTISTFVVYISYLYGTISVVIAQCTMFVILGSYIWSQGVTFSCL
ncbi:uncharacterized protein B0P05DRAFT_577070 [Gilbertella persicaria]|uniref:uncharacterized protein n=1 Tax=Gilbertella persicaria TaxID=101096 RepID=UPI00221F77C5|nr:uncharacterized protein B0P05DRAFT_577070 [Gilbertella persicaria]KAI8095098.1 hypothetical protein B0P05DRAFT_577070 [Gilbertella persicaria]